MYRTALSNKGHLAQVATEHLTCGYSELKCDVRVTNTSN